MFQYNCEVFYEDTDMGGRVYHANYLKFIERARSKFIEYLNIDQRALLSEEKNFCCKKYYCRFLLPAHFGDKLVVYDFDRTQKSKHDIETRDLER